MDTCGVDRRTPLWLTLVPHPPPMLSLHLPSIGGEYRSAALLSHSPRFVFSVGVALAISSGVLIGSSFVFKKKGLIASQACVNTPCYLLSCL